MTMQGRASLARGRPPDMGERSAEGQPPVLELLNLEYIEQNLYRSCVLADAQRPRLYGGQVAAQALYAAGLTVPPGRLPHSLQGYFLREGARCGRPCSRSSGTVTAARSPPAGWWPSRMARSSSTWFR